ncbi:MaoC family dehydratase [Succinimonas sp.]|uniref:MaoC family dehydratase n=1 Tax=Succinimonas sp. TaxID=1936151 RepID=UPI00386BA62C
MNDYHFNNCDIGTNASFSIEITETMMSMFHDISGDENPLHMKEDYARNHGHNGRLVYGLLTSSFYSRLVGMYLPGQYCIMKSIEIFFQRPVYIGDILIVTGRVKEKDDRFIQATISANIQNQLGKVVSKANILVGFYE